VQRVIMRSKIHRATMMQAVVDFQGSCGIAPEFMRATDLAPGEMVRADADNRLRVQAAIA
jgi:aspartate 1-decarboxylase